MLLLAAITACLASSDLHVERANQFTSSTQDAVVLAVDGGGRSVVAWHSRRQQGGTYGVYARTYDASGRPLSDEVQVNSTTASHQQAPSVAFDSRGIWIAWSSYLQDGDYGSIVARRFNTELDQATRELIVNEQALGDQREVVLDCDGGGRALVVWTSAPDNKTPRGLFGRWLAPDGSAEGASFRIDTEDSYWAHRPSVAVAEDGSAVVVWARTSDGATPAGIHGQRFDAEGGARGEAFQLSPEVRKAAIEPVVSLTGSGGFACAWLELRDGEWAIAMRSFAARDDELEAGELLEVDGGARGYVSGLGLCGREDGSVALAWNLISQVDERGSDVVVQRFDAEGELVGEARSVVLESGGDQRLSQGDGTRKLHYGEDGSVIVAWSGEARLGDGKGAHVSWLLGGSRWCTEPGQIIINWLGEQGGFAALFPQPVDDDLTWLRTPPTPHDPPTYNPSDLRTPITFESMYVGTTGAFGFQGIANTGWNPPDPHMAVGQDHVVMVTNGGIAFFGKDGSFQFQDQLEGPTGFWGAEGAGNFAFDPEVIFDPHSGRFMVSANERGSDGLPYFLFAVSDDGDPNGTWHKYRINVQSAAGDTDIDSQNMGVDAQAIYLTADFFGPDKFLVYMIDKSSVLSGGNIVATSRVLNGRQSLGIPVTYDAGAPRQYMIWSPESGSSSNLVLYAINDPLGTPTLSEFSLGVPAFTQPEDAPHAGTSVRPESFESRFWSCVYRNGSLWATHHVDSTRVRQRWYEIDMASWPVSGTPSLVQWGEVDPGGTTRTYFGSIGVDAQGHMALTFAQSSPTELIQMRYAYRLATDPLGTTSAPELARASTSPDTTGRWGDYSTMVADPQAPGTFWAYHQYRDDVWRTWAQRFTICVPPTSYCTASPNSMGAGAVIAQAGSASIAANDLVLSVTSAAANQSGIFYYGVNQISVPFGDGVRCVGGTIFRLPVVTTNSSGAARFTFDYTTITQPQAQLFAGDTRHFQFWFRDPAFGGAAHNLSNALTIQFCP